MIRLTTKISIAKGFSYNMLVRGNHGASVSLLSSMMSYKALWMIGRLDLLSCCWLANPVYVRCRCGSLATCSCVFDFCVIR